MVEGIDKLKRRWAAIPPKVRELTSKEMEQIAYDIVDDMYSLAPQLTGDMAGSIGWTWGEAPKGAMVLGKVAKNQYATMQITIFAGGGDQFYARFQEFGTVKMAANPFFFPAWRARKRSVKTRIGRAVGKAIRETR